MSLIFVPLYIRFMGVEAYGLVGIFTTLLTIFSLLDMGLSNTLNREMARLAIQKKPKDMRDLLRTLELPYCATALLIGIIVIVASPLITYRWVNAETLSPIVVQRAIIIMGVAAAFQWPLSFYTGGLQGLQRQVLLNSLNTIMATCRGLGSILILWLISPTVDAFFIWQIVISVTHTSLVAFFLWHSLPQSGEKPQFRLDLLRGIWRFAAGVSGITILSTVLMQLDKVILSKILNLEQFGYYSLANLVAMSLYRLISPVASAVYPRLTNLVTLGAQEQLAKLYHQSAQLLSVLILPAAIVVALFSKDIMLLWTQSPTVAEHTYLVVSVLVIGTTFNGLMNLPYVLQLASGWTKLAFYVNTISVLVLAPMIVALATRFGPLGAASAWLILNSTYILISVQIMHRRLLPTEKWRWYIQDVGIPLAIALTTTGAFRLFGATLHDTLPSLIWLALIFGCTLAATALTTPAIQAQVRSRVTVLRTGHAANI